MRTMSLALRHELVGLGGVIERNVYLVKRYIWWDIAFFLWTVANTLTIVFIAKGIPAVGGTVDVQRLTTVLLVGAVIWAYLGIIFEILTETVAWERWEGTIEYTFMAPLARPVHLLGMGLFAVVYGVVRAVLLFGVVAAFFGLHLPNADYGAALVLLIVASISFIGIGMMTAVLPLISPEKGTQLGFVAQGLLLVVSGVYYPVSVLPEWMQWLAKISPATYALRGCRAAILEGAGLELALGRHLAAARDRRGLGAARALGLPHRRALRQEAREAEAVGMITIRPATTDADLEAWIRVRRAVVPDESAGTVAEHRARESEERLLLLAELDGELAGSGLADRSYMAGRFGIAPRVLPGFRRRGVGTAVLRELVAHAERFGVPEASALVDDEGSRAFAERFGFREVDRQVEQVKVLGDEQPAELPAGIEVVDDCRAPVPARGGLSARVRGVCGLRH